MREPVFQLLVSADGCFCCLFSPCLPRLLYWSQKSVLTPCTSLRFLGYLCDSQKQAFILPDDERISFASLRESILEKNSVSLKNLQKFAGKTTSFSLLVPAAKLYTNCVFQATVKTIGKGKLQVNLFPSLGKEISHWKFLDSWDGFLKWKQEFHLQVHAFSDASNTSWGGSVHQPGKSQLETRGYWDTTERKLPIVIKESLALLRTLENLLHTLQYKDWHVRRQQSASSQLGQTSL